MSTTTQDQVDRRVARIIDQFPIFVEELMLNRVMRARLNQPGETFSHRSEIWYPPASKARIGRIGDSGETVFYCAESARTALFEIGTSPGDVITLVSCQTIEQPWLKLPVAFVGVSMAKAEGLDLQGYRLRRSRLAQRLGIGRFRKYELIDGALTDWLTRSVVNGAEFIYRPSIGFAHGLFGSPVKVIHYPSVKSEFKGLNLAMPGEVADKHFRPSEAYMVRFGEWTEIQGQRMMPSIPIRRSYPIEDDGLIRWQGNGEGLEGFDEIIRPPRIGTYTAG